MSGIGLLIVTIFNIYVGLTYFESRKWLFTVLMLAGSLTIYGFISVMFIFYSVAMLMVMIEGASEATIDLVSSLFAGILPLIILVVKLLKRNKMATGD